MRFPLVFMAVLAWAVCLIDALPGSAAAGQEHRRILSDPRGHPNANTLRFPATAAELTTRVLLAGDSWARYMWTDGSHNDIFDRWGHGDTRALSAPLASNPGPGYTGPEYAVDGSEAREWVDTANFPYLGNAVAALEANPDIDIVLLSIGGNDMLAGRPDGGWYKDMDLDVPESETALLAQVRADTETIIDALLAVRPDIQVIVSGYDYPNFNVGFWCFLVACPMREDLSRDPDNDLVTDQELNAMLVVFETMRLELANDRERVHFDHGLGLLHYFFGDGVSPPLALPYPGQEPPTYAPMPGGNPLRPTLRTLFRKPGGVDADPIHLSYEGYQYKITNEMASWFLPRLRGEVTGTFFSEGGDRDGWTDGTLVDTSQIALGDNGTSVTHGIVSFDTSSIPDNAVITSATLYLHRATATGSNPFTSGDLGLLSVDVAAGAFGAPEVEAQDATALTTASGVGTAVGSALANGYVVRVSFDAAGLGAIDPTGTTQLRLAFAQPGGGTGADHVAFHTGSAGLPAHAGPPTLADHLGTPAPVLDVNWDDATDVAGALPRSVRVLRAAPNPFNPRTTISFELPGPIPTRATLEVFDARGRLVRTLRRNVTLDPGRHAVVWDGRDDHGRPRSSGIYTLRLVTPEAVVTGKAVLLK